MSNQSYNKLRDNSFYRNDRQVVLSEIHFDGMMLQYASEELQNDKEVVIKAIEKNGAALEFASKKLRNNDDIALKAITNNGLALAFTSNKFKTDFDNVSLSLNTNSFAIQYANKELRNNKILGLKAVKGNGLSLQYLSEDLKNDKEIVLAAVLQTSDTLCYASKELKDDKEIVIASLINGGEMIEYASDNMKNNIDVAAIAVEKTGMALQYISNELKNNKGIVLKAVKANGNAIRYASQTLLNDEDVIKEAINSDIFSIEYIPKWNNDFFKMSALLSQTNNISIIEFMGSQLKKDKDFALICVSTAGSQLRFFDDAVKNDKKVVWAAINNKPDSIKYASKQLQDANDVALHVLDLENTKNGHKYNNDLVLEFLSDRLQDDDDIVRKAIENNYNSLNFASNRIKNDKEFISSFATKNITILEYAGNSILDDDESILMYTKMYRRPISNDDEVCALSYASNRIKNNVSFIQALIQENIKDLGIKILKYAGTEIKNNKEAMLKFIKNDSNAFKYIGEELRNDIDIVNCALENRDHESGIRTYEIENKIGFQLREKIGKNNIEQYCKSIILSNSLNNDLTDKSVETKKNKI